MRATTECSPRRWNGRGAGRFPVEEPTMNERTCSVAACDRPASSRGLCVTHYSRLRRVGDVQADRPIGPGRDFSVDRRSRILGHCYPQPDGCWRWEGSIVKTTGYGSFGRESAHRVVYELLVGPIPEGLFLDHLCRVRRCVNPEHLEPVTCQENARRGVYGVLKTHCANGHPWIPENIAKNGKGRKCRICDLQRKRVARFQCYPAPAGDGDTTP